MISVYYQIRFAKHPTNPNVVGDDLYIVEVDAKPEGDPWCLRTEKEAWTPFAACTWTSFARRAAHSPWPSSRCGRPSTVQTVRFRFTG